MAIIQSQSQKQTQKLTSQQIQLHNILALPTVALEQYIANEMAINPALEFETDEVETPEEKQDLVEEYESEEKISEGRLGEDYDHTDYMDRDTLDDYKYEVNNYANDEDKRE